MLRRSRSRTVAGLVIEPGFVAAASVAVNGHIALDRAAVRPLDADVVKDGEVLDTESLAATLRDMWKESDGLPKRVRIGVANARIVVRVLDLPPVEDEKTLAAAVRFQAEQELPIPLDQAVLDYQRLGIVEGPGGPRLQCLVVVARRELVTGLLTATRAAGLKAEGIDLSAFGMVRALVDRSEPQLYLTVGGLTNMAVSVDGNCIFTRVTGTSLETIAATLASRCGFTIDEARGWLREAGTNGRAAVPGEEDDAPAANSPLILARGALLEGVRQIAGEIRSSLDFFHAQAPNDSVVTSGVLTGPAAAVSGFAEALSAELGLELVPRAVEPLGSLGSVDPYEVTVAAGLALEEAPSR